VTSAVNHEKQQVALVVLGPPPGGTTSPLPCRFAARRDHGFLVEGIKQTLVLAHRPLTRTKHFELSIEDGSFGFKALADEVAAEAALDGMYVIRTNVPVEQMSSDETGPFAH
jgi:hypothetical protein